MYCTALHHITMVGLLLDCVNIIEDEPLYFQDLVFRAEIKMRFRLKVKGGHVALLIRFGSVHYICLYTQLVAAQYCN